MKKPENLLLISVLFIFLSTLTVPAQSITGEVGEYNVYTFCNVSSARFMEVAGNILFNEKYKDNSLIVQNPASYNYESLPNKWQRWYIIYAKTEGDVKYFSIRNAMSGKFLDVPGGVTSDGIQLLQCAALLEIQENKQLWQISEVTSGKYKIINKSTGLAVTTVSNDANAAIVQSAFSGSDFQLWKLSQQSLCSYRDDQVVRFFERNDPNSGSTAFDQASSILLSDGRVMWVTQDSWDGWELTPKNLFNSNYFFNYGNSMFLQPSVTNWNSEDAPNITRENSAQEKPRQICDIQANQTFAWPANGVELNGRVYIHCGEGNILSAKGQSIYEIWPKQEGGLVWNSVRHEITNISSYDQIIYSAGMAKAENGYVYVFGTKGVGFGSSFDLYVARFSQNEPLSAWTFWNGTNWVNNPPANNNEFKTASVYNGLGASVAVSLVHGKYVVMSLDQGFWETNDHYIRTATSDSPIEGYTTQKQIYDISEYIYGTQARYYTPNIHPEFDNGKNELLVAYSLNFSANSDQDITVNENGQKIVNGVTVTKGGYIDPYFYRVKGVRIPYSMLGISNSDIPNGMESLLTPRNKIEIFPNLAKDMFCVKSDFMLQDTTFRIYSVSGILVDSGKLTGNKINIEELVEGIYILNISSEGLGETMKFIKKKS